MIGLRSWLDLPEDKETSVKLKSTAKKALEALFQNLETLSALHADFLKKINERFRIWGPTQLVSDIFIEFYKGLAIYDSFFTQHPEFVMTLDILYRLPSLSKFLETNTLKISDMTHYLQIPIHRITNYTKILEQLKTYTDPSSPDYTLLSQTYEKFKLLDDAWSEKKQSCQAHLMVLEIYRTIQDCPVTVTLNRRLLMQSDLIKIDLEDVSATSDVRTYYLYTDHLIFCRKQKEKRDAGRKLVFKGSLNLRGAEIRPLHTTLISRMSETKKSMFKISKRVTAEPLLEVYGFELITSEANVEAPIYFSNASMPPQMSSCPIRRRHVLRTRSQEEQRMWYTAIENVIKSINPQKK
ncbi:unnamed protein product [Rhizopus stolonifer]